MTVDRRTLLVSAAVATPLLPSACQPLDAAEESLPDRPFSLRQFGAALDGRTDDSDALQRAVDASQRGGIARPILVEGPCRIDRSIFVDRRVDHTRGVLRILGQGWKAGFLAGGSFPLFDSRLSDDTAPQSEYIWFRDIRFEAPPSNPMASVLSDKFLRVQFHECEFEQIKCLIGRKYAQEWHFSRCIAQRWPGTFFSSRGGYHIISTGSKYQNGGGPVFEIVDPILENAGCVGCAFHQDIVEANAGSFVRAVLARGLSISGLYHEGNDGPAIDLEHSATNQGVSITGCMFAPKETSKADRSFFDIRWGNIDGGHAGGNFSSGRLHDNSSSRAAELQIAGDFAALQLLRKPS